MDVRRIGCFMIHAILLFKLATGNSERGKRSGKFLLGDRVVRASPEIDEEVAEQLWIKCRSDLIHMKVADENFELLRQEERARGSSGVNSKVWSPEKGRLQKAINVLPPEKKQTLLGCLRTKSRPSHFSGYARDSRNWYQKYVGYLFGSQKRSGHHSGNVVLQHIAVAPAFAPTPAPAPASGPAVESPAYSPAPSSNPAPASSEALGPEPRVERPSQPYFPPSSTDSSLQPSTIHPSSASPDLAQLPSKEHNHIQNPVIVAVVVTAAGTLALAAMLFFCYRKSHRNNGGSRHRQKDDSPLLNLSLNEFSLGSFPLGNAMKKDKIGSQSFNTNRHNGKGSSLDINLSMDASNSSVPEADIINSSETEAPSSGMVASAPKSGHTTNIQAAIPSPPLKPPPGSAAPPPPAPPPVPPVRKPGPPPPPPPKGVSTPPHQAPIGPKLARPSAPKSNLSENTASDGEGSKTKLKPFFWDKVLANPDHSMVWHQIKEGSFQFNEEMIETLFGYNAAQKNQNERKKGALSADPSPQYIQIIDSKKAQNLAILLRALNVTAEEVQDALQEGNELPVEFLQTLLKMAPTVDEELKLRLFSGDISQLGHAERFLKMLIDIPFAFKRMDALLFMSSLEEEVPTIKESLATLEVACNELKSSRLFLKLLEAVLKTGNRMNDGTFRGGAQAFRLDTLLKLADVKGTDGKTTLLHFVVQEIIRSEGVRAARVAQVSQSMSNVKSDDLLDDCTLDKEDHYRSLGLQVVSGLGGELGNVRKAAALDADSVTGTLAKVGQSLVRTKEFLRNEMTGVEENDRFHSTLKSFVEHAEIDITLLVEEEMRIMALVKSTADYFHGDAAKDEGLRLFVIVRDFLIMLDKACREVREAQKKSTKMPKSKESPAVQSSPDSRHPPSPDIRQKLFPAIKDRRMDDFSSDEESTSP